MYPGYYDQARGGIGIPRTEKVSIVTGEEESDYPHSCHSAFRISVSSAYRHLKPLSITHPCLFLPASPIELFLTLHILNLFVDYISAFFPFAFFPFPLPLASSRLAVAALRASLTFSLAFFLASSTLSFFSCAICAGLLGISSSLTPVPPILAPRIRIRPSFRVSVMIGEAAGRYLNSSEYLYGQYVVIRGI